MNIKQFKPLYLIWIALAAIIIFIFLPITIPCNIKITGKLLPAKEWLLHKGTDGRLISEVKDNIKGNSQNFSVSIFERGDIISFNLLPKIVGGFYLNKDDTVGFIHSTETQRNIAALRGQLEAKQAELEMYRAGEKESLIAMARQELSVAQKNSELQHQIVERQKKLFEGSLVSEENYQIELTKTEILDADVQLAAARLNSYLEGVKTEQIVYLQTQIRAIEQEIAVYQQHRSKSVILSPICGTITNTFSTELLLNVKDIKKLVLVFPVKWQNKNYISADQQIELNFPGADSAAAKIISIGTDIIDLNGNQAFLVSAQVNNEQNLLNAGLLTQGTLHCGLITPLEYAMRFINGLFVK
jgi:hypothetical protein